MVDIVKSKKICLNMIVKNESHIIASTLKNILEHIKIDYWVISDTGSTDDTVDIIQDFFKERGISGEIFHDKWKDFGHNRTKALEHVYDKSDYLFIFDADDLIHGDMRLPLTLDKDIYELQFGNPVSYHRSILISNRMKWKYVGVLHEILRNIDPIKSRDYLLGNYHIESRRLGNRSKNPNKYVDDALILEKGFEEENTDMWLKYRYSYYCAQSYQDAGKLEKAIEWYERTLTLDYSPQYKYCACINAGNCYNALKQYSNAIDSWSEAYTYDKERLEGIVKIMEYFYNKGQHFMVSSLYNKFKHVKICNPADKIFLDYSKYRDFHYYASISGCYCDEHKSAYEACKYMLLNNKPNPGNTIYNLQFYMKHFKEDDDNKSLLDYFVTYIMNPQIVFKDRESSWNIVNSIIKEQLSDKYEILENSILSPGKKNIDKNSKYASSKNILIYTGYMNFLWNDSTLNKQAIGGAEKAVIYLTRNLPKNYTIYIAGDQKEEEIDNIKYINHSNLQKLLDENNFHTIIVSRYVSFFEEYNNYKCYQLLLSAHDTYFLGNNNEIIKKHNKYIDNVVCLTEWHKNDFIGKYDYLKDKIRIINNGINITDFNNENISIDIKIKNKFVWTSRPERGLNILLELWPKILEKIPDATLDISSYDNFTEETMYIKNIIDKYHSITHHGKLNTKELYKLISSADYWLYTCTWHETSCITAMEMLMSNVICLYYPIAGLVDTVGDYGIKVKGGNEIETILNLSEERKTELRKNGKEYALRCSWENREKQWSSLLGLDKMNEYIVSNDRIKHLHDNFTLPVDHINFLKKLGSEFKPNVIYDIGANVLNWTKEAKKIWNGSEIIVFDAVKSFENFYKTQGYKYYTGVLSDRDDKCVKFYQNKEHPAGNSYYKEIGHKNSEIIYPESNYSNEKTSTLSTVVKEFDFPMPDLIKFDVQGAELDIIKGSLDIINRAKYLIVEIQNTQYNKNAPLLNETVNFLQTNGWELLTQKPFCDNGPDGDYCFKKKYKKKWVFYSGTYIYTYIIQYIENHSNDEYDIQIIDDISKINLINPEFCTIILCPFGNELFNKDILNKLNNTSLSFLQLEPLTLPCRLNCILNEFNKFPELKKYPVYDYSKSNIKILNKHGITNCIHLPYKCSKSELDFLINSNINISKEYDFGFIYDWKIHNNGNQSLPIKPPRRNKIMEFLTSKGYTINLISGYGEDRDEELGKCKIILNPHGQINENPNPTPDECSNIFEHIRCDRLLEAGFTILSETSYELDEEFANKYPNLKQISYDDFFNIDVINEHYNNESKQTIKKIYDTLCLNKNPFDYYLNPVDIYEHLPTLYKYASECNSVLECGVRASVSSWALVYGLINNNSDNKKLILNDIEPCDVNKLLECTKSVSHLDVSYEWISDLNINLKENVDLTFIDTGHVGGHLKKELAKFRKLTNKYIIIHDTTVDEFTSEAIRANLSEEKIKELAISSSMPIDDVKMGLWPAIEEFLKNNSDWVLHERFTNNNGLTILKKVYNKPKIIDCFTFYNELKMLNYRLNILNDIVDYFVLVEATHTYIGKEKPLFYQDNKHLFEKFNHKIIHIIVDDFTHKFPNINIEKEEQWINERYQRDCISRGLDKLSLQNNDVITITDLDEIPNPKILEQIKNKDIVVDINILELDFYYYNLNSKMDHQWQLSKILTFEKYNELNVGCDKIRFYNCPIIKNAGWHLSYFGNEKFIKNKLENFSHQEFNKIEFTDEKLIKERINNGNDLFDRPTSIINIPIEDNDNLPPEYDIYLTNFYTIQNKNNVYVDGIAGLG